MQFVPIFLACMMTGNCCTRGNNSSSKPSHILTNRNGDVQGYIGYIPKYSDTGIVSYLFFNLVYEIQKSVNFLRTNLYTVITLI